MSWIIPSHAVKHMLDYEFMNFVYIWSFDVILRLTISPAGIFLFKIEWKQKNVWNLFKVNNKSKFHTLLLCSHCWLWASNSWLINLKYLIAIFQEHSTATHRSLLRTTFMLEIIWEYFWFIPCDWCRSYIQNMVSVLGWWMKVWILNQSKIFFEIISKLHS